MPNFSQEMSSKSASNSPLFVLTHSFFVNGLKVEVLECNQPDAPVIFLNIIEDGDNTIEDLISKLQKKNVPAFSLALIHIPNKEWTKVLSPWPTPKNFPKHLRCAGEAEQYLESTFDPIVAKVKEFFPQSKYQILAGYSLAGLFSLWAACKESRFNRICAVSGSFWYPDFEEWFFENLPNPLPTTVYFSSSVQECQSKNTYLSSLKPTIQKIEEYLSKQGVWTIFEINKGNHFQDATERLTQGLAWTLTHPLLEDSVLKKAA